MDDAVRALRPFVDGIIADVGLAQTRPENLASLGVRWIGFAWAGEDLEDPAVMDAITRFAEKAARDGLAAYAKDLPNRNFVLAAGSLGINHVFAKPHMKPITDPGSLVFRIENLVTAGA
jgi:hypothetical protein